MSSVSKFSSTKFRNIIATLMHINDNILKARRLRKISQEALAEKLGESRSSYAEWEKGTIPRADVLFKIAAILQVDPADLMSEGWEPDENTAANNIIGQKTISLKTIQEDLNRILRHQVMTRAEVRAYGSYPISRDAKGDQGQVVKIMGEIGILVAEFERKILEEGMIHDTGKQGTAKRVP